MKIARALVLVLLIEACVYDGSASSRAQSISALDFCLQAASEFPEARISPEVDQAYVYMLEEGFWVYFTHGAMGTFGKRSHDYYVDLSCAVLTGPPLDLVHLGRPLEDAVVNEPRRNYFEDPEGTIEVLFRRNDESFEYCCSQTFNEANIYKSNPHFPWNRETVE